MMINDKNDNVRKVPEVGAGAKKEGATRAKEVVIGDMKNKTRKESDIPNVPPTRFMHLFFLRRKSLAHSKAPVLPCP